MADSRLDAVRVVLFEPQDYVNIGAVVRAMKNMGVARLRLVRAVEYDPYRVEGIAHGCMDVIDRIERFETLDAAVADCVRVAGFTARKRAAKRAVTGPERAAAELLAYADAGPVALLFGREDSGLPNDALDRAHILVTIPTTEHASLNLAQAVLIGLYEIHLAAGDATRQLGPSRRDAPPSAGEDYERLFADVEEALRRVEFFKTRYAEHIMRTARSLAFRAAPDRRELTLLRAMALEVVRFLERTGRP